MSRWEIWRNGARVLLVEDRPGALTSTAPRSAAHPPPRHPFLTATALDAGIEDLAGRALHEADSVEAFLGILRAAGLGVTGPFR